MTLEISLVTTESEVLRLLPLVRAYCDFYRCAPADGSLLAQSRALVADPACEGVQLLAVQDGDDAGFATVLWSWDTTLAARVGIMHDLFVVPAARGGGIGAALIEACRRRCRDRGAARLVWQTAPDNLAAQSVYDRVGAVREEWVEYWLGADPRSAQG